MPRFVFLPGPEGATRRPARSSQAGRTLLESMISLAIGAVLIGAVLLTVSSSGLSGRRLDAQAALNEEGRIAVNQLAADLRMAGYWQPTSEVLSVDGTLGGQPMVFGCVEGFVAADAAWADLDCASGAEAGSGTGGAVAVRYEAGEAGTAMALDCGGQDVRAAGLNLVEDRFYVRAPGDASDASPGLYCQPTTGGDPILLVEGVERMVLRYGLSPIAASPVVNRAFDAPALEGRTSRYRLASALDRSCAAGAMSATSWCAVTAVDVCLLLRTPDGTSDTPSVPYLDCDNELRTVADRRLRSAARTTVTLRNRAAAVPGGAG